MKLIKIKRTFKDKEGIEKYRYSFYLVVDGISKPIEVGVVSYGKYGNNYKELNMIAEYQKND